MNFQATHPEEARALRSERNRISDLLSRYPRLSSAESGEVITFLRTARHLDVGLLTSDEKLRPKLDAFMEEHRAHFRVTWTEAVRVIATMIAILAILWLVWEAFA